MKCDTCKDKGYVISDEDWNITLQEYVECPDCNTEPKDRQQSITGLVT